MADALAATEFACTDVGNAELFAWLYADHVRFDHRRARWLIFRDHRWLPDGDGEIYRRALFSVRHRVTLVDANQGRGRSAAQ